MVMKLYILGNWVFADCFKGYMLAIGTREDVENQPLSKIGEMILEAIAVSQYRSMESFKQVLH
jgi:hypothetical protein